MTGIFEPFRRFRREYADLRAKIKAVGFKKFEAWREKARVTVVRPPILFPHDLKVFLVVRIKIYLPFIFIYFAVNFAVIYFI